MPSMFPFGTPSQCTLYSRTKLMLLRCSLGSGPAAVSRPWKRQFSMIISLLCMSPTNTPERMNSRERCSKETCGADSQNCAP
jgi:hypothetical protein